MSSHFELLECYLLRRGEMRRFFLARLGASADVDDLVQDLYLKVVGLKGEPVANAPALLYRLAHNLMLDRLRGSKRAVLRDTHWRSAHQAEVGGVDVADAPDAEAAVIARQRIDRLVAALASLSPRTQQIFRLHKFEGLTYGETAQRLGLSKSAVEKHISLALSHLQAKLGR